MSSNFPTLPTGPFEHVALDYARLRAEGIRLLGRLSGQQWTDFNAHDPGITILEQLCYAITDLAYRTNYPIQDLLAGGDQALPEPATILSCNPVTLADLRKLVFDEAGIENAWIDEQVEPEVVFHYQESPSQLDFGAGGGEFDAGPVSLRGLHRVLLQIKDNAAASKQAAIARLHHNRALGEDFEFAELKPFIVKIDAVIEIGAGADLQATQAAINAQIDAYLSPNIRFVKPADAQAAGQRLEQIYEGPALTRGIMDVLPEKRHAIYSSDLIHAIMDVPEVRAVRSLKLQGQSMWMLEVPADACATRDSDLSLNIGEASIQVTVEIDAAPSATPVAASPTPGRERGLAHHQSLHEQLPPAYGVGALGLPASAPVQRVAQVRQLEAYLLIFDQLLANAFAQLSHAHELLVPALESGSTYFSQATEDEHLQELIAGQVNLAEPATGRRKRFLAHLLARFGEHLGEHVLPGGMALGSDRKKNYLEQFPRLSAGRGSGADVLGWVANQATTDGVSVFEERIRARLGLPNILHFKVIEHLLLRPIAEDANQLEPGELNPVPLLETVGVSDPWSLQVSVAFLDPSDASFKDLVKRTLLAETPAHLEVHLHWFEDSSSWEALEDAWTSFRALYGAHRRARLLTPPAPEDPLAQLRVRDARDRLIEMLGLGLTYPLRDIPVLGPMPLFVASGLSTNVTLGYSQVGVTYYLINIDDQVILSEGDGNDGVLPLATPPINEDLYCVVRAVKQNSNPERATTLIGTIWIQEGVDSGVMVDLAGGNQFVEYGAHVTVDVHPAQHMVAYTLFDDDPDSPLSLAGDGDEGTTVALDTIDPVYEDIDLHVHGQTMVGTLHEEDLVAFAQVRVLPNVAQTIALNPGVIAFGGTTKLVIPDSQASVRYQVWGRTLNGSEFVFVGDPPIAPEDLLGLLDEDEALVDLLGAKRPAEAPSVEALVALSDEVDGSGGILELSFGPLEQDTILYLHASKEHQPGHSSGSSRWFANPLVVLVRPNHQSTALGLDLAVANGEAAGPLFLLEGQEGVLYQFRDAQSDLVLGLPLYVYDNLPGIDDIRVQVNLVLQGEGNMPSLDLDSPLPVGTTLEVQAQKAITGITAQVEGLVTIEPSPTFNVPAVVLAGQVFQIEIPASLTDETYQLLQGDGEPGVSVDGTGGSLVLWNGWVTQTTLFEVGVQRNGVGVIPLQRRVAITVEVTPP
jgi:hypothetical protein